MTRINYRSKAFWLFLALCVQENLSTPIPMEFSGVANNPLEHVHTPMSPVREAGGSIGTINSPEHNIPISGHNAEASGPSNEQFVKDLRSPPSSPEIQENVPISRTFTSDSSGSSSSSEHEQAVTKPESKEGQTEPKGRKTIGEWLTEKSQKHSNAAHGLLEELKKIRAERARKSVSPKKQSFFKTIFAPFSRFFKGLKKTLKAIASKAKKIKLFKFRARPKSTPKTDLKTVGAVQKEAGGQARQLQRTLSEPLPNELDELSKDIQAREEFLKWLDEKRRAALSHQHLNKHPQEIGGTGSEKPESSSSKVDNQDEQGKPSKESVILLPNTETWPQDAHLNDFSPASFSDPNSPQNTPFPGLSRAKSENDAKKGAHPVPSLTRTQTFS